MYYFCSIYSIQTKKLVLLVPGEIHSTSMTNTAAFHYRVRQQDFLR